jgi:hypothetical protein
MLDSNLNSNLDGRGPIAQIGIYHVLVYTAATSEYIAVDCTFHDGSPRTFHLATIPKHEMPIVFRSPMF